VKKIEKERLDILLVEKVFLKTGKKLKEQ